VEKPELEEGKNIHGELLACNIDAKKLSQRDRRLAMLSMFEGSDLEPRVQELAKQFGMSQPAIRNDMKWVYEKLAEYAGFKNFIDFINKFIARKEILYGKALEKDLRLANDIQNDLFDRLAKIGFLGEKGSRLSPVIQPQSMNVLNITASSPEEVNKILEKSIERCREYQKVLLEGQNAEKNN